MDQLDPRRASQFEGQIKPILQEKFSLLAKAEESELEEEMNQFDHSSQGKENQRQIWSEWHVITCSAKDG